MNKILSISIAAYNVEKTLREALEPFLMENVRELVDVMIINDGSTDSTKDIAMEYQLEYPDTFRLINKENGGWGSTLNVGIKNAIGKYFKQLDGDDYYSYENLYEFLMFLKKIDADMIHSPFVTYSDGSGILQELGVYEGDYSKFPINRVIGLDECTNFIPAMHSSTFLTKVLQQSDIKITEKCFYTDVEFILKSLNNCSTIAFFEKPIYYYRLARDGQSMSVTGVRKHYTDHQKMLLGMLEYYTKNVTKDEYKKIFIDRLSGAVTMQYIFYFALECTDKQKNELREFDTLLKNKYNFFYYLEKGRPVSFLRKTSFLGYNIIAKYKMMKDKKLKRNIFEGC